MATRAARNTAPKEVFEGRVHKWERGMVVMKKGTLKSETTLELIRWIMTDARCPELSGPRYPYIKPLKRPLIRQPKPPPEQGAETGAGQPTDQNPQRAEQQPSKMVAAEPAAPQPRPLAQAFQDQPRLQPTVQADQQGDVGASSHAPQGGACGPLLQSEAAIEAPTPQEAAQRDGDVAGPQLLANQGAVEAMETLQTSGPAGAGGIGPARAADAAVPPQVDPMVTPAEAPADTDMAEVGMGEPHG